MQQKFPRQGRSGESPSESRLNEGPAAIPVSAVQEVLQEGGVAPEPPQAPPDVQTAETVPLRSVRQIIQGTAVTGKPPPAPRKMEAAAEVPALRENLQDSGAAEGPHGRALRGETVQLRHMWEGV